MRIDGVSCASSAAFTQQPATLSHLRLQTLQQLHVQCRMQSRTRLERRVECAAQPPTRPPPPRTNKRGKALLQGMLRPAEDDPVLHEAIKDLGNPVEAVAMVQWYPGHIARAERQLREQLSAVDIVLEVRDGRIPMSTRHPHIAEWVRGKPRVMVLNRRDMVTDQQAVAWSAFFKARGHTAVWTNGTRGEGISKVTAHALSASEAVNEKRLRRGLRPRPVRAVVVGFPNVGKSALINRVLGRRMADSAPRPGVTRSLKWMRIGGELDLLDAPGIIPMSFKDQIAAQRLAMCNDIGEASYTASLVAAALLRTMRALPEGPALMRRVERRYDLPFREMSEEEFVHALGEWKYNDEPERAGQRVLKDFRAQVLGRTCLELPEQYSYYKDV